MFLGSVNSFSPWSPPRQDPPESRPSPGAAPGGMHRGFRIADQKTWPVYVYERTHAPADVSAPAPADVSAHALLDERNQRGDLMLRVCNFVRNSNEGELNTMDDAVDILYSLRRLCDPCRRIVTGTLRRLCVLCVPCSAESAPHGECIDKGVIAELSLSCGAIHADCACQTGERATLPESRTASAGEQPGAPGVVVETRDCAHAGTHLPGTELAAEGSDDGWQTTKGRNRRSRPARRSGRVPALTSVDMRNRYQFLQ